MKPNTRIQTPTQSWQSSQASPHSRSLEPSVSQEGTKEIAESHKRSSTCDIAQTEGVRTTGVQCVLAADIPAQALYRDSHHMNNNRQTHWCLSVPRFITVPPHKQYCTASLVVRFTLNRVVISTAATNLMGSSVGRGWMIPTDTMRQQGPQSPLSSPSLHAFFSNEGVHMHAVTVVLCQ